MLERHEHEVEQVAASVRGFYLQGEKFRIFHGSTNSTRKSAIGRNPKKVVDISKLNKVLYIDTKAEYALVQPNVPMDMLVEETLQHGLIPPVVMEFPGITVGGGYAGKRQRGTPFPVTNLSLLTGTSGESSSFRYGFFDRTIERAELVLANGDILTCSEVENADLFRGAAGAVGTLGVVTLVKLCLRRATKFVETTYYPVDGGMQEAIAKIQTFTSRSELDYVDGIMYSKTHGAIITGRMTDTSSPGTVLQRFSDAKDPWFYLHVKKKISSHVRPTSEIVPLPDYLFRYDRGGFWVGAAPFKYFTGLPFNDFTRRWLDDFLHTRMLYNALHASGQSEKMIIQDLSLPYSTASEFVGYADTRFGIYPLWLCPLKQSPMPTMHPHAQVFNPDGSLEGTLNIGLWGLAPPTHDAFLQANRDLEHKLRELGGMKWLYAQTYYTEEEFWSQFDKDAYDSLRKKYSADLLPTVYEKVRDNHEKEQQKKSVNHTLSQFLADTWPISGLYSLTKAIESGDHVRARESTWKRWVPRT